MPPTLMALALGQAIYSNDGGLPTLRTPLTPILLTLMVPSRLPK